MARDNELYLAVLPIVHLGMNQYGLTEQVLTMLARNDLATEFASLSEADMYISMMERRANEYLTGGNVTGYTFQKEVTTVGRVIVKVIQHVNV